MTLELRVHLRWWVRPMMAVTVFVLLNAWRLRLVSREKALAFARRFVHPIARRGVRIYLPKRKAVPA